MKESLLLPEVVVDFVVVVKHLLLAEKEGIGKFIRK